jgi:hypothetical protein
MSTIVSRPVIAVLLLLFTLISGVWLSHSGKPLSVAIFTIHKLIALATVIVIAVNVVHLYKIVGNRPLVDLFAILITALFFLALFISGALLSFGKPVPGFILSIHLAVSFLVLVSATMTIYLLVSGRSFSQIGG